MRYAILLLILLGCFKVHAQEEYIGKPFDSVYSILSNQYVVDQAVPYNPALKAIQAQRIPFYGYKIDDYEGVLLVNFNVRREIDTVRWECQYSSHGWGLPEKHDYAYKFIDSIRLGFEQKFGRPNEVEEDKWALTMSWAKLKSNKSVASIVRINGGEITAVFFRSEY